MSIRKRLLASLLTLAILLMTIPVSAFAAEDGGGDIVPFSGGGDADLENSFKVMNMKSAFKDCAISKYAYLSSENKFYTIINLQNDTDQSEWTYLEYTLQLGQAGRSDSI